MSQFPQQQPPQGFQPQQPQWAPQGPQQGLQPQQPQQPLWAPQQPQQGFQPQAGSVFPVGGGGRSPTPNMTQLFAGIGSASASNDKNYLVRCHVLARIDLLQVGTSRGNGPFFVAEMTCMGDLAPTAYNPSLQEEARYGYKPGQKLAVMHMAKFDSFLSNVKSFLMGATGLTSAEITDARVAQLCDPSQPLANTVVELSGKHILTKGNKRLFTVPTIHRHLSFATVREHMLSDPEASQMIGVLWPNGLLDRLCAEEVRAAVPQTAQQQQPLWAPQPQHG